MSRSFFTSSALAAWIAAAATLPACSAGAPSTPESTASTSESVLVNGDFESGAANVAPPSWTLTNFLNNGITVQSPQTRAGLNLAVGGKALTVTLAATNTADALLGATSSMRYCRYGSKCAIVNRRSSDLYTDGLTTNGQNVNSLSQTMTVTAADVDSTDGQPHVRFVVSPVLENPGHPSAQQPYYMVQVTNTTTGALLYSDFNLSAQPGVPWKIVTTGGTEYDYIDWSLVDVYGAGKIAVGDSIKVEVIAAGCSLGGHLGQVYVDGGPGISVPGLFISGSAPTQVNAGVPITYAISYKNASAAAATGVTMYFTTPPNTTFASIGALPSGLTCTPLAVGATGTISCTLAGSLAVNGGGAFNITVTPTAAATGTEVIAGTYGIDSAEESPLLGPKMRTFVGCTADAQCSTGNWCNISTKTCVAKTANDVAMPTDAGHASPVINSTCSTAASALVCASAVCETSDNKCGYKNNSGTCTAVTGATVCRSAVCDTTDSKCGYLNGDGPCTTVNQGVVCRSLVCDANDSKCGYAVGDGPCTVANEATVCRSGSCSSNGTCRPVGGCNVDADCAGGAWCMMSTHTCTAKLTNGTAMPTDAPHTTPTLNGTCTTSASTLVCASAVCDTSDAKCGYANGTGPCTSVNEGTVCRSGSCSTNGTCKPVGGCNVDGDCAAGNWCMISTHTCTAKLANGTAMPTDAPHTSPTLNGVCTTAAGALVCTSAVCDTADSKCGYANGDGPCTSINESTVCRSGSCSTNGTCKPVGGCNVDGDCAGGNWCMISTHTCTPKLANGSGMPTDAPHTSPTLNGTCTSAAGALVCTSAVCDTADSKCGYADGDGPCTIANGATVCRSGECSAGGTCKPAGGCNVDADCAGGNWCMESTHTCTAKLSNGTAMPTDAPHTSPTLNGVCTSAAGTLVCASSVCDTTDAKCGYANGSGPCTTANQGTVCRSGACSANGTCMPSGGCNVDGDCNASTEWCQISTHTCTAKLSNGTAMPTDAPHSSPTLNGTCTTSASALVCTSAVCDASDSKCGYANGTGPCTTANQATVCRSGTCSTNGTCMPVGGCNVDGDCLSTEWCQISTHACVAKLANGTAMPTDAPHTSPTLNGTCTSAAGALVCTSAVCDAGDSKCGYANGTGPCTTANQATVCRSGACSTSGTCMPSGGCNVDGDCATTEWCIISTHTCATKLANGTAMPTDAGHTTPAIDGTCNAPAGALVCASAVCDAIDSKCGFANGTGPCTAANGATVCRSGECSNDGKCKPAGGCNVDADCTSGNWCVISTHTCTAKLVNGAAMPTDAGHVTPTLDGTCSGTAAALVCVSAVCDAADAKCGYANGHGSCDASTSTTVCRSGACGSDGKCGLPNGEGACTAANGDTVCRSEVCDADGKCGLANGSGTCTTADGPKICRSGKCSATSDKCVPATNGCAVDGDCAANQWCNISALTCQPKVANDVAMPSDTGHVTPVLDGKCAGPAATLTCVSGVCDPRDDKCGYDNEGTSSCTATNAVTVCRSGFCSATGKCIAAASCLTDADCPDAWCNVTTKKCAPKVPNGQPMPTDSAHGTPTLDGKCSTSAATLVCVAGVCETTDDQCGLANGSTCVAGKDATCRSNVCWAADLKCGKPVGEACTDSAECRSANCAGGKCDGDADGDGVSDLTETSLGTNPNDPDSDHDGVRDNVELTADHTGNAPFSKVDTDGDGTIDALDEDDDGDTVPTKTELGTGTLPRDTDADGKLDYLDDDDDGDSVPTKDELGAGGATSPQDTDGDGKVDFLDTDDDEDSVPTKDEIGTGGATSPQDTDGDGKKNYLDTDDDGDSLLTSDELGAGGAANPVDTDGDGKKDYLDADDDDDGILTSREVADGKATKVSSDDVDKDGKKNWLDTDSDGDTIPDGTEPNDADGDEIPDYLQAKLPISDAGTIEGGGCSTSGTGAGGNVIVLAGLLALGAAARVRRRRHG